MSYHVLEVEDLQHEQLLAVDTGNQSRVLASPRFELLPSPDVWREALPDLGIQDIRRERLGIGGMYDARVSTEQVGCGSNSLLLVRYCCTLGTHLRLRASARWRLGEIHTRPNHVLHIRTAKHLASNARLKLLLLLLIKGHVRLASVGLTRWKGSVGHAAVSTEVHHIALQNDAELVLGHLE